MFNKKNFKAYIPKHPFRHGERGEHDAFYFRKDDSGLESALKEYGAIRDPLTDAERQILLEAFGTLKPSKIRRHLENNFTPAKIENLTWGDVVLYAQSKIDTTVQAPPKQDINAVNSKSTPEEIAAYRLTRLCGYSQKEAADLMNADPEMRRRNPDGIKQYRVSRLVSRYVERLKQHGLPVEPPAKSQPTKTFFLNNIGKRTDGRRPKKRGF